MDPTKASSLHHFIYREINSDLTSSDLVQLKAELRPYLDRDTINKCQDGYDICRGLERAGHISIGNYEVLKTILEAAGFINLLHCIETKSAEIEPAQGHNISDNDHRRRDILHHAIYREIVTDLTSSDFEELKAAVRPYLDRAIIDRCQNGYTICDELEKSGVISKGNYEMLKTILNSAGLINLRERIETRAAEIEPDVPTVKTRKVNENNVIHNEILQLVNQEIIPNEFRGFQRAASVYLSTATVARCKSGFHICCELEKAGKIKVGDYENLKEILVMADLISVKKRIEEEESKIIKGSDEVPKTSHCSGDGAQGNVHDTHSPEQASSGNKDSIDDGSDEAQKTSHYSGDGAQGNVHDTLVLYKLS
ncbi:uncharacterized protein LOC135477464 isoform X2 [Liolophura sinensis]|uniref:uncharacterized protein LOC135477464 isoform X2 n=1 Tax=Liolophura sinensis TaxID=3198878 RepID=UPI0031594F6A